jgi:hypothetical protein
VPSTTAPDDTTPANPIFQLFPRPG